MCKLNIFINLFFALPLCGYEPTEEKSVGKESEELVSYTPSDGKPISPFWDFVICGPVSAWGSGDER